MKTSNVLFRMVIIASACALSSCFTMRDGPDLQHYESYQICNTSATDITLHFFVLGKPKTVYAEILDKPTKNLSQEHSVKPLDQLLCDSAITLTQGKTALLYTRNGRQNTAYNLVPNGDATSLKILYYHQYFLGDSTIMSVEGQEDIVLPTSDIDLWDTWYDEETFLYYNFFRIE